MPRTRILLVEDEDLIRLLMSEALEEEGFDVTAAASGEEAARALDTQDFRLVLTDLHMPGALDGIAVARKARERSPEAAVIYMSGRPDLMPRADRLGPGEASLAKPYSPSELVTTIRRLLGPRPPKG